MDPPPPLLVGVSCLFFLLEVDSGWTPDFGWSAANPLTHSSLTPACRIPVQLFFVKPIAVFCARIELKTES